jgi:AsmA family protein
MAFQPKSGANPARPSAAWRWLSGAALSLVVVAAVGALLWDWNWFRSVVEARTSAGVGRRVTLERLEVHPGLRTSIIAYGVQVANPDGFEGPAFASFPRMAVTFDAGAWVRTGRIVLPVVEADHPTYNLIQTADGRNNWTLPVPSLLDTAPNASPPVEVGDVVIDGGTIHFLSARVPAEMMMDLSTGRDGDRRTLVIDARGTYANQPVTAHMVGGALLSLGDAAVPYSVDLALANGATRITLKGTVRNVLALSGANLDLTLDGPDMALLFPLTGIPIPKTPPYGLVGKLDFADGLVKLSSIKGRVGSTDLSGDVAVDPRGVRPILNGALTSRQVDMEDLGGIIGSQPGRTTTPGQTAAQVQEVKRAEASLQWLPNAAINMPRMKSADIHITYAGAKIIGKNAPFESISTKLDIVDGHVQLTSMRLGIAGGVMSGSADLTPVGDELDANVDVKFERVNVGALLESAGLGHGNGPISGSAQLKGRGASVAGVVGHGDGALRVVMARGGEINALLLDLSGVQLGRAVLSAVGLPDKEHVRCMVADFTLRQGILASRTLVLNTTDHVITGGGRIDLAREVMELRVRSDTKHLSIGTLATPILIYGAFKDLHYRPDLELAARGGAAVGLGLLFLPAALLPTIQFGVGDDSPCAEARK